MIAIVGGGIAGLTTAIALRKAGFEVIVFDRVRDVAAVQIGAGVGLALNATRVLRALGLLDQLREVGSPGERFEFRDRKGKLLSHWEIPKDELQLKERDDLEDALALPVEPVADVAELPERAAVRARLLGTSRSAVCSPVSPSSIRPFGSAQTSRLPAGRIAAISQWPSSRRTSTPPAENSRRTVGNLNRRQTSALRTEIHPVCCRGWHSPRVSAEEFFRPEGRRREPKDRDKWRLGNESEAAWRSPDRRAARGGADDVRRASCCRTPRSSGRSAAASWPSAPASAAGRPARSSRWTSPRATRRLLEVRRHRDQDRGRRLPDPARERRAREGRRRPRARQGKAKA